MLVGDDSLIPEVELAEEESDEAAEGEEEEGPGNIVVGVLSNWALAIRTKLAATMAKMTTEVLVFILEQFKRIGFYTK